MSQHSSPAENGLITAEAGQALMARPCGGQKRIFCDLHRTSAYMYRVHTPLTIILDAL